LRGGTAGDIQKLIGKDNCKIIGNANRRFTYVASVYEARPEHLTFCARKGDEALLLLRETKAGVILCDQDTPLKKSLKNKTLVVVYDPRLWFIRCMNRFFPEKRRRGLHPTVVIGRNSTISNSAHVYAFVYIGDNVKIGNNVTIKSGSVIGSDGFGFVKNQKGVFEKFPHIGGVIIGDNVDIGANTCIDRGTLGDTTIGQGTKIDNLVHIAHNVVIGKNCAIIAQAMIGGSAKIGDGSWIAPTACIRDGIVIGKNVLVGMGAVVTKNVDDDDIVLGVPAKSIKHSK